MSSLEIGRFGCRCGRRRLRQDPDGQRFDPRHRADSQGIVHTGRSDLNPFKRELAEQTNPEQRSGGLAEALVGADVFLGVSAGLVPEELIATMAPDGIVFALSNPDPEIHPDVAKRHAAIGPPGAATSPIRSTTCWPSRVCSGARSTPAPAESPRR